jgi:hypothetical protein
MSKGRDTHKKKKQTPATMGLASASALTVEVVYIQK